MTERMMILHRSGPGVTVQDLGRTGYLAQGLSRGGAADPLALADGAALLGQSPDLAALEIAGTAVVVEASAPMRIALSGAPMRAERDGAALIWNAGHELAPGQRLNLSPGPRGSFAYLSVAGGIATPERVGGRGAHLAAGLGSPVKAGSRLPVGGAPQTDAPALWLPEEEARFDGGSFALLPGPQTHLFDAATLEAFFATTFTRTAWGNRQGVKLGHGGEGVRQTAALDLLSEVVVPGDVQITGDGTPYVLGPECQTIGGYPRIGTLPPTDLCRLLQATPGSPVRFRPVTPQEALATDVSPAEHARRQRQRAAPLLRDPRDMPDLLSYSLISGVTAGRELTDKEP
ncbi:MAG: biotin-dependent carboxyltransferase family protein [Tropicimonas sp.]|uniref:5-oxoprolinase subunit C family protein n=1 Tax=Tropicimonas sp. TaxID=2067044 RepID=UPI003A84C9D2